MTTSCSAYIGNILIIVFYHTDVDSSRLWRYFSDYPIWKYAAHKEAFLQLTCKRYPFRAPLTVVSPHASWILLTSFRIISRIFYIIYYICRVWRTITLIPYALQKLTNLHRKLYKNMFEVTSIFNIWNLMYDVQQLLMTSHDREKRAR